jgi:hypothetical protein
LVEKTGALRATAYEQQRGNRQTGRNETTETRIERAAAWRGRSKQTAGEMVNIP